jgi:hypothetical protein
MCFAPCDYHIFRLHTGALRDHEFANEEVPDAVHMWLCADGIRKLTDQRKKCKEKLRHYFKK